MTEVFFPEESNKTRLDLYLSEETGRTRSSVRKFLERGLISVNGKVVKAGYSVKAGDEVRAEFPEPEPAEIVPNPDIPLCILYEDDSIAVINKQQGLTVHPAAGNYTHTLVNALLSRLGSLSGINGVLRPGIVHRLDKDTSGVLVVAKNDKAHVSLSRQIAERTVKKIYLAIVFGAPKPDEGIIDLPIGRDPKDRKKMAVVKDGRRAVTGYRILERFESYSLLELSLYTGRTHQIRVHLKSAGCPVACDFTYGRGEKDAKLLGCTGQLLHSGTLEFTHPDTGNRMSFTAPLPKSFEAALTVLRKKEGV